MFIKFTKILICSIIFLSILYLISPFFYPYFNKYINVSLSNKSPIKEDNYTINHFDIKIKNSNPEPIYIQAENLKLLMGQTNLTPFGWKTRGYPDCGTGYKLIEIKSGNSLTLKAVFKKGLFNFGAIPIFLNNKPNTKTMHLEYFWHIDK